MRYDDENALHQDIAEVEPYRLRLAAGESVPPGELRDLVARSPHNAWACHYLGVALERSGDAAGAGRAFRESIRLHPGQTAARVALTNLLRRQGDLEAARLEAEAAYAVFPDAPDTTGAMGLILTAMGNADEAQPFLQYFLHACYAYRWPDDGMLDEVEAAVPFMHLA